MTIDNELVKQALQLQRQVGRENWMDDVQTIRAMRVRKVEWKIIYTLIAQKHALEIPQEVFEQKANSMLRSISATATKKKKQRLSNVGALSEHRGSIDQTSTEQRKKTTPETSKEVTQIATQEGDLEELQMQSSIT